MSGFSCRSVPPVFQPLWVKVCMAVTTVIVLSLTCPTGASADALADPVEYSEPVDGLIIDGFRPPPTPYAAGNRGVDYLTVPGSAASASADGEVVFAGNVGGSLHVTILHQDGLRTSYSFLASVSTAAGRKVKRGEPLGTTSSIMHFGVRTPEGTYIDPQELFDRGAPRVAVRLVPGADEGRTALIQAERRALWSLVVNEGVSIVGNLVAARADVAVLALHYLTVLNSEARFTRAGIATAKWALSRLDCTPSDVAVPAPKSRRIVVEVAGLGSSSETAAIARLDTEGLGYSETDVIRFSYAGGRVPSASSEMLAAGLDELPETTYTSADTQVDMNDSAQRLAELVAEVARMMPGVPIDVIAHSQGGVVARLALHRLAETDALPGTVENLVTLGSPHEGSDVATAVASARVGPLGDTALDGIRAVTGLDLDPDSPSIAQLSEVSELTNAMAEVRLPSTVRFTSIGARGDLVVAAPRTVAPGARHAIVPLAGPTAHDSLPSASQTTREVGLALAGMPPTCVEFGSAVADFVVGDLVSTAEDSIGLAALAVNTAGPPVPRIDSD